MLSLEQEPIPQPSQTEVLDQLIDPRGRQIKEGLMNQLVFNSIRLVVLNGAPRIGKTTLAMQLGESIEEKSHGVKTAEYMFFDDAMEAAGIHYGLKPMIDWDEEWELASKFYAKQIEERLSEINPSTILIAENVGIGETDRGRSTLEDLARIHKVDAFFLAIIGDPKIGERATRMRQRLLEAYPSGEYRIPDDQVLRFLESHQILVSGNEGYVPEDAGRLVREAVLKMDLMQDPPITAHSEAEEEKLMEKGDMLLKRGLPRGRNREPEIVEERIKAFREKDMLGGGFRPIPPALTGEGFDSVKAEELRQLSNRYELIGARLHMLGLSTHRFIVAHNRFIENKPIHYLDLRILDQAA